MMRPILPLVLCLAAACNDDVQGAETYRTKLSTSWQELQDYAVDQRDVAQEKLEGTLAELDRDVDELERRMDSAGAAARAELDEALVELRAQRDELARELTELRESGAAAWEENKDEIVDGLQSVQRGLSNAWDDLTR
jgi:uncharacterized coiled-coil DUF342 family protein